MGAMIGRTLLVGLLLGACSSGPGAAPPAHGHAHWDYEREGPATWGALSDEYRACLAGRAQSPIDLSLAGLEHRALPLLEPHYSATVVREIDNGHTIQDEVPQADTTKEWIAFGPERYRLQQFHYHHPSEHTLDGKHFPLEIHLVHKSERGKLLVVGVLVGEGAAHPTLETLFRTLPAQHEALELTCDPATLMPPTLGYLTYEGSLTTPPCTEGVTWVVLATPIQASADQLARFAERFQHNNRPTQPRADRAVRAVP